MARARDEAGNIWDVTDPNNPVLVQAAQSAQPAQRQGGFIPDPYAASNERRREEDQAFEAQRLANEAERLRLAQQQAVIDRQRGEIDVQRGRAGLSESQEERAEGEAARTASEIRRSLANDNILNEINRARGLIGTFTTGNTFGSPFFQGIPILGQGSTDLSGPLDTIKANLSFDRLSEMRTDPANKTGGALGSVSNIELNLLGSAVSSLNQEMSPAELQRSLATIERHYRNVQALFNGEDPREPEVAEKYGIILDDDGDASTAPPPDSGELTSQGRFGDNDPALRGVNSTVRDMIRRGRSPEQIRDYLNTVQPGLGDRAQDLERAVNAVRQNPDQEFNVDLERQWIPNSGAMQAIGEFGMSPLGSALIGAADTASLGFLDNLTSNPEMARAVMAGVSEENPTSYLLGQIVGGAGTGIGLEAAIARGGLTGIRGARAGDALFGAGYGAGMADDPEDSRVASALLGAGAGVAGGAAGRGIARAGGRALSGIQDASRQALNRAGISMTPGQILGGAVQRTEDRLAGFPIIGDAIQARRREGIEGFNRAAFQEAVDPISAQAPANVGAAGIDAARQLRSDAYSDALSGVQVQADQAFENDIASLLLRASDLPESMADTAARSLELRIGAPMGNTGQLSGSDIQQVLRGLRRDARSVESQPFGYDVAQINRAAEGALEGMVERQSPGVVDALRNANAANMNVETLRAAVNAARNQQGEMFTPAQLSTQAAITARRFGNNQGTTNQPFYGLTRAGQEVLPSQIPDSGTAGRAIIPYLLLSGGAGAGGYAASEGDAAERAGAGAGSAAIAALVASAPYSAAARDALQRLLLSQRPQAVSRAGDALRNNADIAGLLAAPAAVGYVGQ